jgi:U3 small nucleolar RNA-associated protein 12
MCHILTLSGHHSEVWGLCVSRSGSLVVSGGNDRSIRVWARTDEPVFLDSEREKERNESYEKQVATEQQTIGVLPGGLEAGGGESVAVTKGKATSEMLRDSERVCGFCLSHACVWVCDADHLCAFFSWWNCSKRRWSM